MKIALVGNQNSGKTSLFNLITGKNQYIANYPGATVDFLEGVSIDKTIEVVDLPGIYSLTPHTPETEITTSYLLNEKVDLIINVLDATTLERGLYLTTQLLDLEIPMVVALNMIDRLHDKGMKIHTKTLEKRLGVSFFEISAAKKTGVQEMLCDIGLNDFKNDRRFSIFKPHIEKVIDDVTRLIDFEHKRYYAIKLLEDINPFMHGVTLKQNELKEFNEDIYELFAESRYAFIERILSFSVSQLDKYDRRTQKIDKVLLHKWFAIPIFLLIMFVVYMFSVGFIGTRSVEYVEMFIEWSSEHLDAFLAQLGAHDWSRSLLIDGVIAGVGAMMAFVPQLIILFIFINILEATGYMTRIAFFLDKVFRKFGLSGRALIPFIIGSGCSIPGIMATRTIENKKEREFTTILTPMVPCSAKLPVIALFAGVFFSGYAGLVTFLLYVFSIIIIIFAALLMKVVFKVKRSGSYLSELPTYKLPKARYVYRDVVNQTWDFVKNATTIILLSSVVVWVLVSFDFRFNYGVPVEDSILAHFGRILSYVFYPFLGELSWASSVSAIQGLVAKEQVVSSMNVIAGVEGSSGLFDGGVFAFFTAASALSFMIFNLFSAPCFGAIAAMRVELGSMRKTLYAVIFQTSIAYVLAILAFWLFRLGGL